MLQRTQQRQGTVRKIRQAIENYPGGICIAAPDGRPILTNKAINNLCFSLLGHTIINAGEFWENLSGSIDPARGTKLELPGTYAPEESTRMFGLPDGRVWQIQKQTLPIYDTPFIQLEAEDITDLYRYSLQLYENNLHIKELNQRQRLLIDNIVQINLDRETLRAKMRIHDEFGRCLLATKKALTENELDNAAGLTTAWKDAILNMTNATQKEQRKQESPEAELLKVADLIGCRVEFIGEQPKERMALLLLYAAVREALTNAVRHAGADKLTVLIEDKGTNYYVKISSNGTKTVSSIREGNGLGNLRRRLEQEGATMDVRCNDGVTLVLTLPKEGKV